MIIREITLRDYGVFEGELVVPLVDSDESKARPVVIFYGNNGSGKTTLLEAISLCIYGRYVDGKGMSQSAYEKLLASRVHESPDGTRKDGAAVKLVIEYMEEGESHKLVLTRSWEFQRADRVEEKIDLASSNCRGQTRRISRPDQFLLNVFPIGISQLVFFDGEKIKAFAEGNNTHGMLRDGFFSLTGVDLVERAEKDLELYSVRLAKREGGSSTERWDQIETRGRQLRDERASLAKELESVSESLKVKQEQVAAAEKDLAREGAGYSEERSRLLKDEALLERERNETRMRISKICDGLLPFVYAPNLVERAVQNLSRDLATREARSESRMAEKITDAIRTKSREVPEINGKKNSQDIQEYLEEVLKDVENLFPEPNASETYDLSESEIQETIQLFRRSASTRKDLHSLIERLDELDTEITSTRRQLERVPAEESLLPYIAKLHELLADVTRLQNQKIGAIENIEFLDRQIAANDIEQERELEAIRARSKHSRKLRHAKLAMDVLKEYHGVLARAKIEGLEEKMKRIYNALRSGKEEVRRIAIDSERFTAQLERNDGVVEDSGRLSAGEKQLYAIALLGAITGSTSRNFPFLVDTPLARLDKRNRLSVTREFLPTVSEQVVLFVTNTEMTKSLKSTIAPHIAREYRIRFNKRSGRSRIREKDRGVT